MADIGTKISELPAADALTGTEFLPGVQGGQTKKATAAQIVTLVKSGLTKNDVGLGNVVNERQYSEQNPPPTPTPAEIGAVPSTRTINGKALSADITLDAEDIGIEADAVPTEASTNLVESGGVYAAILALLPIDTASGDPASFPDGADGAPVVDLTVDVDLAQSGSGTPSPANVRPITPWTGLTLSHSGADTSDPEELAVSWADAAGHIWAGTLDVTTGVLTELYYDASEEALGMVVTGNTPNETVQARFQPNLQQFSASAADIISDYFSSDNGSGQSGMIARVNLGDGAWIYLNIPQSQLSGTTTADAQAWAAAKKPVILLKRTTPVTWQLTPHEVKTLLGENNYWADTGAVTVEYRADLEKYIEKKIGE